MNLVELQTQMDILYGARDRERGLASTVAWLAEEVGELAQAVRKGSRQQQEHEIGDVLAWLASLANQLGVSLQESVERWASGCPHCAARPCQCLP
jgi:NTP pyrophosphatase (non-canonical NTP hydrolase)